MSDWMCCGRDTNMPKDSCHDCIDRDVIKEEEPMLLCCVVDDPKWAKWNSKSPPTMALVQSHMCSAICWSMCRCRDMTIADSVLGDCKTSVWCHFKENMALVMLQMMTKHDPNVVKQRNAVWKKIQPICNMTTCEKLKQCNKKTNACLKRKQQQNGIVPASQEHWKWLNVNTTTNFFKRFHARQMWMIWQQTDGKNEMCLIKECQRLDSCRKKEKRADAGWNILHFSKSLQTKKKMIISYETTNQERQMMSLQACQTRPWTEQKKRQLCWETLNGVRNLKQNKREMNVQEWQNHCAEWSDVLSGGSELGWHKVSLELINSRTLDDWISDCLAVEKLDHQKPHSTAGDKVQH